MKAVIQPLAWGIAMASILAVATGFALAVTSGTVQAVEHSHGQHAHGEQVSISAPDGQRWATDPSLREGMSRIQDAVQQALPSAPQAPLGAAEAAQLRDTSNDAIAYMVDNCELPAEADAALHLLLAELIEGANALSQAERREAGLEHIVTALQHYAETFDEPLWR
ncbi:DnrO protein [Stutzerimonas nitrititolerans]|uniref:DnrO protein n=1 Tax=Stutzerimonas nitrititolerans TaxID=2482751 RepID=UPI0028AF8736|nr:DnrO protein [Stutzerimonas nitrititolerans]